MNTEQKTEHLKYILDRYDHYIESIQSKCNLYIGLNTLLLGGIITLLTNISLCKMNCMLYALVIIITLSSIISIIITLSAIKPHLSGGASNSSLIFFNDVSKTSHDKYLENIDNTTDETFKNDLVNQVHCVAGGLSNKYKKLSKVSFLQTIQFIALLIWIILFTIKNH